ncbi:MAG: hypothetical protein U1D30_17155 [Planctomycetota bacterium]
MPSRHRLACRRLPPDSAQGGVFLIPLTGDHPRGKLRLLYEANPIAFTAEQAGKKGFSAGSNRVLNIQPTSIHFKSIPAFIVGSQVEMAELLSLPPRRGSRHRRQGRLERQ